MTIFDMFKPAYCSIYRQCYLIYFCSILNISSNQCTMLNVHDIDKT